VIIRDGPGRNRRVRELDQIPEEFAPYIDFAPGEKLLGCWFSRYVAFDTQGRVDSRESWSRDLNRWLFVLTNHRIRHIGPSGYRTFSPSVHWNIPLTTVDGVSIDRHPAIFDHLLTLRILVGLRPSDGGASSPVVPQWGSASFIFEQRVRLPDLSQAIVEAVRAAAAGLRTTSAGPGSGPSDFATGRAVRSHEEGEGDSPIRFNAQDDP
jgi:hypothetical protein